MTLISFTLNIAGPVKNSDSIKKVFEEGLSSILTCLKVCKIPTLFQESLCQFTGNEAFIVVDYDTIDSKRKMAAIEDGHALGRLFDIDVLDKAGDKISREEISLEGRKCLICGGPVLACSSRRIHSAEEIQEKTFRMIEDYFKNAFTERISYLAGKALLYEVSVSPKPGLVDRYNQGSHKDMDFYSFINSSLILMPYFKAMTAAGMEMSLQGHQETFSKLQYHGIKAEGAMYEETKGVNTHKGAIFSLGTICGALGRLKGRDLPLTVENILQEAAALLKANSDCFFDEKNHRNRDSAYRLYRQYGIKGIRGEAAGGFPSLIKSGLPILKKALQKGYTRDEAGGIALLHLLLATEDTTLIFRSNYQTYKEIKTSLSRLLEEDAYPDRQMLNALDEQFISQNLSAGGAADLLAICWFFYFLESENF